MVAGERGLSLLPRMFHPMACSANGSAHSAPHLSRMRRASSPRNRPEICFSNRDRPAVQGQAGRRSMKPGGVAGKGMHGTRLVPWRLHCMLTS